MKSACITLLLICGACSVLQAEEADRSWNFQVYLDDKPIGYHRFTLHQQGERRELRSTARFTVKILLLTAYRYVHDDAEIWRGDCLQSMTAQTDDNGKKLSVAAQLQGADLHVNNLRRQYHLTGCVMSFAYWNPAMLQQTQLLNAQTGEYDRVTITALGEEARPIRGAAQLTRHYRLTGNKLKIDLWYSRGGDWVGLESTTENGRRLRYLLN